MCVCSRIGRYVLNHWATWEASQCLNSNVSNASELVCHQLNWLSHPLQLCTSSFSLQNEMATHSSILAWKIPWTEEPGRLQSMGLQRVGHDWATSLSLSFILDFFLIGRKKKRSILFSSYHVYRVNHHSPFYSTFCFLVQNILNDCVRGWRPSD